MFFTICKIIAHVLTTIQAIATLIGFEGLVKKRNWRAVNLDLKFPFRKRGTVSGTESKTVEEGL